MTRIIFIAILILFSAPTVMADGPDAQSLPPDIRDYKSWSAFPNVPLGKMDPALCYIPPQYFEYSSHQEVEKGPHKDKFLSVYFNRPAEDVVEYLRSKSFPAGSVVLKEKRTAKSASIDGIGVMLKHEKGFDLEVGDWEFMYLDANNKFTRGNTEAKNCKTCHMRAAKTDFIFGNYAKTKIP